MINVKKQWLGRGVLVALLLALACCGVPHLLAYQKTPEVLPVADVGTTSGYQVELTKNASRESLRTGNHGPLQTIRTLLIIGAVAFAVCMILGTGAAATTCGWLAGPHGFLRDQSELMQV